MTSGVDLDLLQTACRLTEDASRIALRWFGDSSLKVERKADGTPVTAADREIESALRRRLGELFPADGIAGEEDEDRPGTSGRCWVIDPIDGTKAFTHGVPLFSTLLALEIGCTPVLGVIHMPALGETVAGATGIGAFHNGVPCRVNSRDQLRGSYLTTSAFDTWPPRALTAARLSGAQLRTWGDGYGYALVATGRVEAMVDAVAEHHDLAAPRAVVEAAGGTFTDWDGNASTTGGNAVASNGPLHSAVLGLLRGD
ncbi:MAG: histidinol-phosphatase [Acidimicrobiales bacterium]|nr:MAG: histidinol-phosphatase [Acidimicrobiales bacterium]